MPDSFSSPVTRRDFLSTSAKLGAFIAAAPYIARGAEVVAKSDQLNVALIGCGEQGRILTNAALKIPGIRFKAVVDIWGYNRTYAERLLKKFGHDPKPYEDYRQMLAEVTDLDAVIIATPDFKHAEHTVAALKAGKHVYCEKLMSNTVEGARSMVLAARETKNFSRSATSAGAIPAIGTPRTAFISRGGYSAASPTLPANGTAPLQMTLVFQTAKVSRKRSSTNTVSPTCMSSVTGGGLNATRVDRCQTWAPTRSTSTTGC